MMENSKSGCKCPNCGAAIKFAAVEDDIDDILEGAPENLKELLGGLGAGKKQSLTICDKCALPLKVEDGAWVVLPPEEFHELPPQLRAMIQKAMKETKEENSGVVEPGKPDVIFAAPEETDAVRKGSPILLQEPSEWDAFLKAHGCKKGKMHPCIEALDKLNDGETDGINIKLN